ncbi:MAG: ATP-binding protein [bacterium]
MANIIRERKGFRVSARTVLQLGAELIGSDAIAFYELIKNAFDAYWDEDGNRIGEPSVKIDVINRMDFDDYKELREKISYIKGDEIRINLREWKENILSKIIDVADESKKDLRDKTKKLKKDIGSADSLSKLIDCLDKANYIEISDTGVGMSLIDLDEIYLTIGTSHRYKQREEQKKILKNSDNQVIESILGEKGIGRLSTMRLGMRLMVETTKKGEERWHRLDIDWSRFSENIDQLIDDIEIEPEEWLEKNDLSESGTKIFIYRLNSAWSKEKVEKISKEELSKLVDPFISIKSRKHFPIDLFYNGDRISFQQMQRILLENAHAYVKASFNIGDNEEPVLSGLVDYRSRNRRYSFEQKGAHLRNFTGNFSDSVLKSLGPFSMEFYWYNRQKLDPIDGIGKITQVKKLIEAWSGGLMLFRDGFRVYPYGSQNDDWLDIDRWAFKTGGYKANRQQIIGKVNISSITNPHLVDQTNREGIRDCEEKEVLKSMLQHIILIEFKKFAEKVDTELKKPDKKDFEAFVKATEDKAKELDKNIEKLLGKYPEIKKDEESIKTIYQIIKEINQQMSNTRLVAENFEDERTKILHLAGLGLMVEIVAHELNRTTEYTLSVIQKKSDRFFEETGNIEHLLSILQVQLKTLQKRLKILDPLSTAGRQVKEEFDLVELTLDTLSTHEAQFERHDIKLVIDIIPEKKSMMKVKMVKGMVVQIIENLMHNSIYWLKSEKIHNKEFKPLITLTIDTKDKKLFVSDNGPGVDPAIKDMIFEPFYSTKPAKEKKGLGLYISREIAAYHSVALYLSDEPTVHEKNLNTFILDLKGEHSLE